jgi:hypothetical protein
MMIARILNASLSLSSLPFPEVISHGWQNSLRQTHAKRKEGTDLDAVLFAGLFSSTSSRTRSRTLTGTCPT